MKSKAIRFLSLIILFSFLLSACGSAPAPSWPGITLDGDKAYLAYSQVFVVRSSDGILQGKFPEKAEGTGTYARPAINNGLMVVGDYSNNLDAVDMNSLTLNWKFSEAKSRYIASALILEKTILAPNTDGNMYALDIDSGQELWRFEAGSPLWAQPLYDGKTVYLAGLNHTLFALNPDKKGEVIWKADLGGAVVSTPLLDKENGIIYVGTLAKEVMAVNTADGKILWRNEDLGESIWSAPEIKDQLIYVANSTGTVFALNSANGKIAWQKKLESGITGSGALTPDGIVFITEKGDVVNLGFEKGDIIWSTPTELTLYGSPISTTDSILIGATHSNDILMISLDFSGKKLWTLPVPK